MKPAASSAAPAGDSPLQEHSATVGVDDVHVRTPTMKPGATHKSIRHIQSVTKRTARWMDVYAVEPREGTALGGVVTIAILPLTIVYVIMLFMEVKRAPPNETRDILWTSMEGPFAAEVKCEAASGCWASNHYAASRAEEACVFMNSSEVRTFNLRYSYKPDEGLSVLAMRTNASSSSSSSSTGSGSGSGSGGAGPFLVASIKSDMNQWTDGFEHEDGVMTLWGPGLSGTVSAALVKTTNETLSGRGRHRTEYFMQHLSSDDDILAASTSCTTTAGFNDAITSAAAAGGDVNANNASTPPTSSTHAQLRVRMAPEFYTILVQPAYHSTSFLFGTCAGTYAAFVAWGSLLVAGVETGGDYLRNRCRWCS